MLFQNYITFILFKNYIEKLSKFALSLCEPGRGSVYYHKIFQTEIEKL